MNVKNVACVVPLLLVLGCTALERADVAADVANYAGSTATDLGPALTDAALKAAGKASSLPELIAYLAGLVVVVGGGYVTRKWIQGKYAKQEAPKA